MKIEDIDSLIDSKLEPIMKDIEVIKNDINIIKEDIREIERTLGRLGV